MRKTALLSVYFKIYVEVEVLKMEVLWEICELVNLNRVNYKNWQKYRVLVKLIVKKIS